MPLQYFVSVATIILFCCSCTSAFSTKQPTTPLREESYYDILGVPPNANLQLLKQAFRQKAKDFHPDNNPNEDVTEKFLEINRAYEVLKDPDLKKLYDRFGEAGVGTSFASDEREVQEATERYAPRRSPFYREKYGQSRAEEVVHSADSFFKRTGSQHAPHPNGEGVASATVNSCVICGGSGFLEEVVATYFGNFKTLKPCHACNQAQNTSETISSHLEITSSGLEMDSVAFGNISKDNEFSGGHTDPTSKSPATKQVPEEEEEEEEEDLLHIKMQGVKGKDLYAILGVSRNASPKSISEAYRMLEKLYHPKTNLSQVAVEKYHDVTHAYNVLGDEQLRQRYDELRKDIHDESEGCTKSKEKNEVSVVLDKTDFYEVLGVSRDSSPKAIEQAYEMLARIYHQGALNSDPSATARMKEINCAISNARAYAKSKERDESSFVAKLDNNNIVEDHSSSFSVPSCENDIVPVRTDGSLLWSEQVLFLDLYEVLGVSRAGDAATIKHAFMMLTKLYSPGGNADSDAMDKFQQINLAYEVLGNDESKKHYDSLGMRGIINGNTALENIGIDVASVQQIETIVEGRKILDFEATSGKALQNESTHNFCAEETRDRIGGDRKKKQEMRQTKVRQNNYPDMRGQVEAVGRPSSGHDKSEEPTQQPGETYVEDVFVERSLFERDGVGSGSCTKGVCQVCGGSGMRVQISQTRHGEVRMQRPCKACCLVSDASNVMIHSLECNKYKNYRPGSPSNATHSTA